MNKLISPLVTLFIFVNLIPPLVFSQTETPAQQYKAADTAPHANSHSIADRSPLAKRVSDAKAAAIAAHYAALNPIPVAVPAPQVVQVLPPTDQAKNRRKVTFSDKVSKRTQSYEDGSYTDTTEPLKNSP